MRKLLACFAVLAAISLLSGCQGQKLPAGMPELVPFEITVTQDGKPLAEAAVELKSDASGYMVDGRTDELGKIKLKTNGQYEGIPKGEYIALVTKNVTTKSQYADVVPASDKEADEIAAKMKNEYVPTHCYVDKKFSNVKTSGLTVSVTGPGATTLDVGKAVDDIIIPKNTKPRP
ncbi:MAG: hypothetical protein PHQ75_06800 [Thermoguttaceae bacterium]|nr:hypothetical protein [Thermoguttaceae bacterium]